MQNDFGNLTQQVHKILIQIPGYLPSQGDVAAKLNLSRRILVLRLKHLGTTYQEILNHVRQELAVHYFMSTNWTLDEIANMLGYENTSNFGRAFKRWAGKSPVAYRT